MLKENNKTNSLRHSLRFATSDAHHRLENHPLMARYAKGELSPPVHRALMKTLYGFWAGSGAEKNALPHEYDHFLNDYRHALWKDSGVDSAVEVKKRYDPLAFYYILLGSSHGAKYMMRDERVCNHPSYTHLSVLAEEGGRLWKGFVSEFLSNEVSENQLRTVNDSVRIFEDLFEVVEGIAE